MTNENQLLSLLNQLEHPEGQPPQGLSDQELAVLAIRLRIDMPEDLKQLLRLTNAPVIGGQTLLGVCTQSSRSIEATYQLLPEWHNLGWLPIGADGCGNYYVLLSKGQWGAQMPVAFIEATTAPYEIAYIVASDIEHFVRFLVLTELKLANWPFDRHYVLTQDPKLMEFSHLRLPWTQ